LTKLFTLECRNRQSQSEISARPVAITTLRFAASCLLPPAFCLLPSAFCSSPLPICPLPWLVSFFACISQEFVLSPDDFNEYEKAIALYLDCCPQVLWWYRNLVGPDQFSIQGYKRPRIYPDFVVQEGEHKKPIPSVLVVESKGKHLQGNPDTTYKRSVADYFSKLGHEVPWQKLAEDFSDSTFRVQVVDEGEYGDQTWRDELKKLLETA